MPDTRDRPDPRPPTAEPSTEEYVGDRDLTRWSKPAQSAVSVVVRSAHYVSAHAVLFGVAALGLVLVAILTWLSAEVYESVTDADGLSALDEPVLELAISLRTPTNVGIVNVFTQLGGTIGMTIITLAIVITMTVIWRSRTPFVLMSIGVAGSLLITVVGKNLVGRARPPYSAAVPPYETSWSFPSGHTLNSTVIASLVAYLMLLHLTSKLAMALSIGLAVCWFVAMGLSRVFLGHHWLTDVIVGWTLGLAWVAVVITAHRLYLTVRRDHRQRAVGA